MNADGTIESLTPYFDIGSRNQTLEKHNLRIHWLLNIRNNDLMSVHPFQGSVDLSGVLRQSPVTRKNLVKYQFRSRSWAQG